MSRPSWLRLENEAEIPSPALILYWDRIEENLRRMIALAGDPARLRPHIKTHKLPQLVARQVELGIHKFKCSTIAEAELAAAAGAPDVLLAAQPVGPHIDRLLRLIRTFPETRFSTLADTESTLENLSRAATAGGVTVEILLDLNVGQDRTGIRPGAKAAALYRKIASLPGIRPGGLHAYDGHIHETDLAERTASCEAAFAPVEALRASLLAEGLPVPRLVAGGTPTFPIHARRPDAEYSPGTCVLWDAGYEAHFPDLDFLPAAALLARVVSRPAENRICLDLGHKAVASEMPHPRVIFPELPGSQTVMHNEEHLVLETDRAAEYPLGSVLYGIPWHVCPTVALQSHVYIATEGRVTERWPVIGRARCITL